jgi:hypothetical protein
VLNTWQKCHFNDFPEAELCQSGFPSITFLLQIEFFQVTDMM